jgi:hypothetical protein
VGFEFIESMGNSNITMESDSLSLIQACNAEMDVLSPSSAVLADCFMRANSFDHVEFRHCPRDANTVVHNLARQSFLSNSIISCDGTPPDFKMPFVMNDVILLAKE